MMFTRVMVGTCVLAGAVAVGYGQGRRSGLPADEHMAHMMAADMAAPVAQAQGQGDLSLPASNDHAKARLEASPRHGEWVKVAWEPGSKDSLMAWIVYPSTNKKAPVVVVVHEIFGLSTWVRAVADQAAAEGFIAIAPDLESRVRGGPSTAELPRDSATRLIQGVDFAERNRGIDAVANYAMSQPSAEHRYAVIGYCWGGSTVWGHAVNGGVAGYSGGVAFYGTPFYTGGGRDGAPIVMNTDSLKKITKPVMLLSGELDARIGAAMPFIEASMKALGKDYFGKNYPNAIHGFLRAQDDPVPPSTRPGAPPPNPDAPAGNLAATKDAWPRTVAFLKKNLGVK